MIGSPAWLSALVYGTDVVAKEITTRQTRLLGRIPLAGENADEKAGARE